ncbi:MAG: hypothetical protein ACSHYA_09800 [Opitutaceae bacterium]
MVRLIFVSTLLGVSSAHAFLGSFEGDVSESDGYHRHNLSGGNGVDASDIVSTYNSGVYSGSANRVVNTTNINAANTGGLWTDLNHSGAAPAVYGLPYYVISHRPYSVYSARTGDAFLGIRNDGANGSLDLDFRYSIDSADLGGTTPASVTSGVVNWSIWLCPQVSGFGEPGDDYFHWSFRDSSGNLGFQLGYDGDNTLQYRDTDSGAWTSTGFTLDTSDWDQVNISFDLDDDSWDLSVFDTSASQLTSLVSEEDTGMVLSDVASIDWHLEAFGSSVKHFFDDSEFGVVPEHASFPFLLSLMCAVTVIARRRK